MRYLGDDEATEMKGIGLYQGTDGNLYEWVEEWTHGASRICPKQKAKY